MLFQKHKTLQDLDCESSDQVERKTVKATHFEKLVEILIEHFEDYTLC